MKEYLVVDLSPDVARATRELNTFAAEGWHVIGTLYYSGNSNAVILERDLD
jgi:hypothetical protein